MATKQATKSKGRAKNTGAKGKTTRNTSAARGQNKAAQATNEYAKAQITTDPDEIRHWVQERGGYPATVNGTGDSENAGVLRIDYPGFSGEGTLQRITWEEFFDKFDQADLVFLYQEETKDGEPSRFSKFISREEADARDSS